MGILGRIPIPCKKCGVYLSGKSRDNYNNVTINEKERGLCNSCLGIGYTPENQSGKRKILFKKKK